MIIDRRAGGVLLSTRFWSYLLPMGRHKPLHWGHAEVAQLVERNLAKVEVAGSSPVFRSRLRMTVAGRCHTEPVEWVRNLGVPTEISERTCGDVAEWLGTALQKLLHRFDSGRRLVDAV